jgi:elongation factor Ts
MERRVADSAEALLAMSHSTQAGAIVELRAETDFVTRSDIFQQLCVAVARTAAREAVNVGGSTEDVLNTLSEAPLEGAADIKQLRPDVSVAAALLELGSVLGERLLLSSSRAIAARPGGVVAGYAHRKQADSLLGTGRMAALVSVLPEGGAVDTERLHSTALQLARHIVAAQPRYVDRAAIPCDVLANERRMALEAHLAQVDEKRAAAMDKKVLEKIVDGKEKKFVQEVALLGQEILLPQGDQKPPTVEKWLRAEASSLGVSALKVDGFHLALL